ncbi:hypothetical protein JOL62DRAFT_100075 [Phyllosticta paracitricarpa]|uniref:Uncharacterized protein n=1 Tax=Phyllosticta paracitricarpa TaxID=2016321 RepID=A0ABR1N929_9PEZI
MSAARDTGHAVGTEGRGWGGAAKEAMERRRRARSQTLRAIHRTMRCHGAAERPTSSDHSPVAAARDIPTTELGPGRGMSETNFFFKFFFFFTFPFLFSLSPFLAGIWPDHSAGDGLRCAARIWHFAGLHPPSTVRTTLPSSSVSPSPSPSPSPSASPAA